MKSTATYIAILLLSSIFCTNSLLQTPEAEKLIQSIFLQTYSKTELNPSAVKDFISGKADALKDEVNQIQGRLDAHDADCEKHHDSLDKVRNGQLSIKNQLAAEIGQLQGKLDTNQKIIERITQEQSNYRAFANIVSEEEKVTDQFNDDSFANYDFILSTIDDLLSKIKELLTNNTGVSFIQVPHSYNLALAQIKAKFSNHQNDITGFKPIIANLLEILSMSKSKGNSEILRNIFDILFDLKEAVQDQKDKFSIHVSSAKIYLHSFLEIFIKNTDRSNGDMNYVNQVRLQLNQKLDFITNTLAAAQQIVDNSEDLIDELEAECFSATNFYGNEIIAANALLGTLDQLQDLVIENTPAFIQLMKKAKKSKAFPVKLNSNPQKPKK